jgi:hypothetical protein
MLMAVVVALSIAQPLAAQTSTTAAEVAVVEVEGVVTVDGVPLPSGVDLVFVSVEDETLECGAARTGANGRFSFTVEPGCAQQTAYVIRLSALEVSSASQYLIDPEVKQISADFTGLSEVELQKLGITAAAESGDGQQAEPLLERTTLTIILLAVILVTALVLMYLMYKAASGNADVKKQTEAMILVGVIIAIILLGVTGKVGSDGLVSVLAGIVGWTAARATVNA